MQKAPKARYNVWCQGESLTKPYRPIGGAASARALLWGRPRPARLRRGGASAPAAECIAPPCVERYRVCSTAPIEQWKAKFVEALWHLLEKQKTWAKDKTAAANVAKCIGARVAVFQVVRLKILDRRQRNAQGSRCDLDPLQRSHCL